MHRQATPFGSPSLPSQGPTDGRVLPALAGVCPRPAGQSSRPERGSDPSRLFLYEYRDWAAVALFLLVTVEVLATMFGAATSGPGSGRTR